MTSPALPGNLSAALDAKLEGLSRSETAARAALISKTYRDGGTSAAIRSEADALAYVLARMPATYAAVAACLQALRDIRPDFAPKTLLDVGAGPEQRVLPPQRPFRRSTCLRCWTATRLCANLRLSLPAATRASKT